MSIKIPFNGILPLIPIPMVLKMPILMYQFTLWNAISLSRDILKIDIMCKFRVYIGHIFVYCNMITPAVLAKSSVMSHNYHIVLGVWKQLRSSLLATLKFIIHDYGLYLQYYICDLVDLLVDWLVSNLGP